MPRKLEAYIEGILKSIIDVETFTKDLDFDQYAGDAKTKAAVKRKLLTIGEALNQASQMSVEVQAKVTDFRKIVGFRNILVHGYFGVDDALVWDIITTKLKQLKKDVVGLQS